MAATTWIKNITWYMTIIIGFCMKTDKFQLIYQMKKQIETKYNVRIRINWKDNQNKIKNIADTSKHSHRYIIISNTNFDFEFWKNFKHQNYGTIFIYVNIMVGFILFELRWAKIIYCTPHWSHVQKNTHNELQTTWWSTTTKLKLLLTLQNFSNDKTFWSLKPD